MQTRTFNFSAGPAILPLEVLEVVRENLLSYQGSGVGVMEMSHRSPLFEEIIVGAEQNLRELLGLSEDYEVLFTTGGATTQFSMVPMNLLAPGDTADYIISGIWAKKAAEEAAKFGSVHVAASAEAEGFTALPREYSFSENARYVHFTSNNTIYGTQFHTEPEVGDIPLVCDASSDFLCRPLKADRYALLYAGAQKNIGPAGVTVVIIRKDLLSRSRADLPLMLNYRTYADHRSLYNTPPTFPIYVTAEVLKWIKRTGLEAIEQRNREKAAVLYDYLDSQEFYRAVVAPESRSLMNVTFRLADAALEGTFLAKAQTRGFRDLKGHRTVGGVRASIYNAFPIEGVRALVEFMKEFAESHS